MLQFPIDKFSFINIWTKIEIEIRGISFVKIEVEKVDFSFIMCKCVNGLISFFVSYWLDLSNKYLAYQHLL